MAQLSQAQQASDVPSAATIEEEVSDADPERRRAILCGARRPVSPHGSDDDASFRRVMSALVEAFTRRRRLDQRRGGRAVLIEASELRRFRLSTVDGAVGRVHDLQMDGRRWTVTDVVVGLGHWLTDRSVILSPASVVQLDGAGRSLRVALSADELARAPSLATHPSVAERHHVPPYQYLGLPLMVGDLEAEDAGVAVALLEGRQDPARADGHLRSLRALTHYRIEADGGTGGCVEDWLVELRDWSVAYVVVRVALGSPRRHVLLPVEWLGSISWTARVVYAGLTKDVITHAPDYRLGCLPDRNYEARLAAWYREPAVIGRSGSRNTKEGG